MIHKKQQQQKKTKIILEPRISVIHDTETICSNHKTSCESFQHWMKMIIIFLPEPYLK